MDRPEYKELKESIELSSGDDNDAPVLPSIAPEAIPLEQSSAPATTDSIPHANEPWKRKRNQKKITPEGSAIASEFSNAPSFRRRSAAFILDCGIFSVIGSVASVLLNYLFSLTLYPMVNAHVAAHAAHALFVMPSLTDFFSSIIGYFLLPMVPGLWLLMSLGTIPHEYVILYSTPWPEWLQTESFLAVVFAVLANPLLWIFYNALSESSPLQGTLGKRLLKIKVVNQDGSTLTFRKALLRFGLKSLTQTFILFTPLFLFLMLFFRQLLRSQLALYRTTKRLWHDQRSGTQIVTNEQQPPATISQ